MTKIGPGFDFVGFGVVPESASSHFQLASKRKGADFYDHRWTRGWRTLSFEAYTKEGA